MQSGVAHGRSGGTRSAKDGGGELWLGMSWGGCECTTARARMLPVDGERKKMMIGEGQHMSLRLYLYGSRCGHQLRIYHRNGSAATALHR
jgi:hypothetical protein